MTARLSIKNVAVAFVLSVALLASGCSSALTTPDTTNPTTKPTTPDTTKPTTVPTTVPTTTPSSTEAKDQPFQIEIVPLQLNGFSIAGQRCVFLVTIADEAQVNNNAVDISATANDAEVIVEHKSITKGQVAEVTVIPASKSIGKPIEVNVTGTRDSITSKKSVTFDVIEGEDDRKDYAVEMRDRFVAWLAKNKPELKITGDTKWTPTMVSPQWLVVSHYLFFSDEWEMHVEWHIMIAPSDWVRIDLRHRFDETKPSYAFEISSRETKNDPIPIEVPEMIWR